MSPDVVRIGVEARAAAVYGATFATQVLKAQRNSDAELSVVEYDRFHEIAECAALHSVGASQRQLDRYGEPDA